MSTNSSKLIEAQGAWLKTFAWDFYFTGTFAQPVTANGARFLLSQYVERLEIASNTSVSMFWAVEKGTIGGTVHVHGLIGNVGTIPPSCGFESRSCAPLCATHLWHVGKAQVRPYDSNGAAAFYISKTIFYRDSEWSVIGNPTVFDTPNAVETASSAVETASWGPTPTCHGAPASKCPVRQPQASDRTAS